MFLFLFLLGLVLNHSALFGRVNFKGCVEKEELLKIVERLWRQERNDKELLEKMEDDSLCKICMDAPVSFFLPKEWILLHSYLKFSLF